ncbi:MAG: magnesium/cobalt transporter CorA [bacterium]|jgi:magnesium transporter
MARSRKRASRKSGLPPGTLVATGGGAPGKMRITLIDYTEGALEEREIENVEECFPFKGKPSVTWINVDSVLDVDVVGKIGAHFGLHPLVMEDIVDTNQRPKVEDFGDLVFVVLMMLYVDKNGAGLSGEQVSLIVGPDFVISFQERPGDVFEPIRERLRKKKGRVRSMGADYLAYALIDAIVDNYFSIVEWFGDKTEEIENDLITNPTAEMLHAIYGLKRELLFVKKSVWPLREVINSLQRGESGIFREGTVMYLRDVYDHTIQVIDTVESQRDIMVAMRDTYLSSVSNRMNEVMKVLTIIATIFIPITFVAGIYGMNFEFMPELAWPWGYFGALGLMGAVSMVMVIYFRRKGWL